ncbi:hypothetical protein ALC57_15072, partial [Trachymyrmex cornetzi]
HLDKLLEEAKNWKDLERQTTDQRESGRWFSLRDKRLTASNFGPICRMRPTTSCAATVRNILYPPLVDTAAMKYDRDREEVAKEQLAAKLNKDIKSCGLFIDSENPCLGCTDGLIDEDGVVEIKCPQSAEHLTVEEAVETLVPLRAIFNKKDPEKMNRNHKYFYQIQGQLNITKRDYMTIAFLLYGPKSMKIIHVNKDNAFWKKEMLPRLIRFYYECMLPEIVDSRYNRNMPIRDPGYILQAQGDAAKKINLKKRIYSIESDNAIEEKKCKSDISLTETAIPATVDVVKIKQDDDDDDCVIISYDNEYDVSEADMARQRKFPDDNIPLLSSVKKNVLPTYSKLNDESLDRFLRVVRETSSFETQSVLYLEYPHIIQASHSDKSIQIIGGIVPITGDVYILMASNFTYTIVYLVVRTTCWLPRRKIIYIFVTRT